MGCGVPPDEGITPELLVVGNQQAVRAKGDRGGKVRDVVREDLTRSRVYRDTAQLALRGKQQHPAVRSPDDRICSLAVGNRTGLQFREVAQEEAERAARVLGRKSDPPAVRRQCERLANTAAFEIVALWWSDQKLSRLHGRSRRTVEGHPGADAENHEQRGHRASP